MSATSTASTALADALEAIPPKARARLLARIETLAPSHAELNVPPEAAVERLLRTLAAEGRSEHTLRAYRHDLGRLCGFLEGRGVRTVSEVEADDVRGFLAFLSAQGVGPSARSRALSAVRRLFETLGAGLPVRHQPAETVRKPRTPRAAPDFLTVSEVEEILDAARGRGFVGVRNRALIEVLYSTGCLVAEVVSLDLDDVDLDSREVILRDGKGNERPGLLVPAAAEALARYVDDRAGLLLAGEAEQLAVFLNDRLGRLTVRTVHRVVAAATRAAGIARPVSPRTIRRSCAMHLLERGCGVRVVQELLGHESAATTQRYVTGSPLRLAREYRAAHPHALIEAPFHREEIQDHDLPPPPPRRRRTWQGPA